MIYQEESKMENENINVFLIEENLIDLELIYLFLIQKGALYVKPRESDRRLNA